MDQPGRNCSSVVSHYLVKLQQCSIQPLITIKVSIRVEINKLFLLSSFRQLNKYRIYQFSLFHNFSESVIYCMVVAQDEDTIGNFSQISSPFFFPPPPHTQKLFSKCSLQNFILNSSLFFLVRETAPPVEKINPGNLLCKWNGLVPSHMHSGSTEPKLKFVRYAC